MTQQIQQDTDNHDDPNSYPPHENVGQSYDAAAIEERNFDVIIAGGGLAGLLAAVRLKCLAPKSRCLILEKEAQLGGRLCTLESELQTFGYGLNGISESLRQFWMQSLNQDPNQTVELSDLIQDRQQEFGVLAGQKIARVPIGEWFRTKGARILGGLAAAKEWEQVDHLCQEVMEHHFIDDDDEESEPSPKNATENLELANQESKRPPSARDHDKQKRQGAFAQVWTSPRKSPAAVVLEHLAAACGIPDLWGASVQSLAERSSLLATGLYQGNFYPALNATAQACAPHTTVKTQSRIVHARLDQGMWTLKTETGEFKAPTLIVAQNPWTAQSWLPRTHWPAHILQIASKTKPVSIVTLSEKILDSKLEIPDLTVIPAERVQMIRSSNVDLCFQATIDFELSLQAPAVIKAVKALKRARKKFLALYPGSLSEKDHIALQPVAWA